MMFDLTVPVMIKGFYSAILTGIIIPFIVIAPLIV